jgi:hypothetical protein
MPKAAQFARWAATAMAATLLPLAIAGCSPKVASCDSNEMKESLQQQINEKAAPVKVTTLTDYKTVSSTDQHGVCSVHVKMSDNSEGDVAYELNLEKDGKTSWKVTGITNVK